MEYTESTKNIARESGSALDIKVEHKKVDINRDGDKHKSTEDEEIVKMTDMEAYKKEIDKAKNRMHLDCDRI